MKSFLNAFSIACLLAAGFCYETVYGQSIKKPFSADDDLIITSTHVPYLIFKDEQGKVLTQQEAQDLFKTGHIIGYKKLDQYNHPYVLLKPAIPQRIRARF